MAGQAGNKKDAKNEGRSDYLHENKGRHDTLSETKDGILTQLHANLDGRYMYLAPMKLGNVTSPAGQTVLPSHFSGEGERPS